MIFDKLVEIMMDQLSVQPQDITPETSFKDDLALDSLDLYDLVMALEDEFNIEMPTEREAEIETIEDLIRILKELGVEPVYQDTSGGKLNGLSFVVTGTLDSMGRDAAALPDGARLARRKRQPGSRRIRPLARLPPRPPGLLRPPDGV